LGTESNALGAGGAPGVPTVWNAFGDYETWWGGLVESAPDGFSRGILVGLGDGYVGGLRPVRRPR
jgi:hypothetical protein